MRAPATGSASGRRTGMPSRSTRTPVRTDPVVHVLDERFPRDKGFVVKVTAPPAAAGCGRRPAGRAADGARRGMAVSRSRRTRRGRLDGGVPAVQLERARGGAVPARLSRAAHGRRRDGARLARHDPGQPRRPAATAGGAHLPERLLVPLRAGRQTMFWRGIPTCSSSPATSSTRTTVATA